MFTSVVEKADEIAHMPNTTDGSQRICGKCSRPAVFGIEFEILPLKRVVNLDCCVEHVGEAVRMLKRSVDAFGPFLPKDGEGQV